MSSASNPGDIVHLRTRHYAVEGEGAFSCTHGTVVDLACLDDSAGASPDDTAPRSAKMNKPFRLRWPGELLAKLPAFNAAQDRVAVTGKVVTKNAATKSVQAAKAKPAPPGHDEPQAMLFNEEPT